MNIVYLNGEFMPAEHARISPMDRGFLFGEGIYEVIPADNGRMIGFNLHVDRLLQGLQALELSLDLSPSDLFAICRRLLELNPADHQAIYLQVTRGASERRTHAYPGQTQPTLFAYAFEIAPPAPASKQQVKAFAVMTTQDLRWKRCNIKSTSLLGNVLHHQQGNQRGYQEVVLFNAESEITEASSSNLFVVRQGTVITPALDHQILPGITRKILIDVLRNASDLVVEERSVHLDEMRAADEVWLTSSTKGVVPVVRADDQPIADGKVGDLWQRAQMLFERHKFEY